MRDDLLRQRIATSSDAELCELVRVPTEQRSEVAGANQPCEKLASAAFGELYSRHREAAMANAYRLLGNRDAAEDAVAEAFSKCLSALRRGLGPSESFLGYLMVAVRGEAMRGSRTERNTDAVAPEDLLESRELVAKLFTEDHATGLSERDQLVRAFGELPEKWQRVLLMIEIDDLSMTEAAAKIGMTVSATNSLAGRAREGLRAAYLQQYAAVASKSCSGSAGQLARLVRGGLSARSAIKVQGHLSGCPHCTEQMQRLSRINEQLKTVVGPVLAAGGVAGATAGAGGAAGATGVGASGAGLAVASGGERTGRAAIYWKAGAVATAVAAAGVAAVLLWPKPVEPLDVPPPISEVNHPAPAPEVPEQIEPAQPQPAMPEAEPEPSVGPQPVEVPVPPAPAEDDTSPGWVVVG